MTAATNTIYNIVAMKKINAKIRTLLILGSLSALLLVGGIPMIIIGAGKNTFVMILGIIFVALNFYACPILFSSVGGVTSLKRTVQAVMVEHLYSVSDIAVQTGKNEDLVKQEILTCMEKGYITGLLFDGKTLSYNDKRKADRELLHCKCESCGATVNYFSDDATPVCPYCGTPIKR